MTEPVRFAFIGTGGVATLHAEALARVENARLAGVWGRSPDKAQAFAARFGAKSYGSFAALLADPTIDAVAVLAASEVHAEFAIRCLEAGKHVLLEKPIGRTIQEIAAIKAAAAKTGRLCMPSHNYIHAPDLREAKRRLDQGDFGRLSSFWLIYNQSHPAGMGTPDLVLSQLMVHHVYAAIYFAGRPKRVSAAASNVHFADKSAPDQVTITCEHEGGAISVLWGSLGVDDRGSSPWSMYYKLIGTSGGFQKSWNDSVFGDAPHPGWDKSAYRDSFVFVQDHFVNQCLRRGAPPLSDLDDAIAALRIVEAAGRSMAEGIKVEMNYG